MATLYTLLRLFVQGALGAARAELINLKTTLDGLLVLACVVVHLLADGALQFDQIVLRHTKMLCGASDRV